MKKVFLVLCIVTFSLFISLKVEKFEDIVLQKMHWKKQPSIIFLSPVVKNNKQGAMLVRVSDGKENFLPGDWNVSFADTGTTYIFSGAKIYSINDSEKIIPLELPHKGAVIEEIIENKEGNFIAIKYSDSKNSNKYCIMPKGLLLGEKPILCAEIGVTDGEGWGMWHPEEDAVFLFKNSKQEFYIWNDFSKKPTFIDKDLSAELYATVRNYFSNDRRLTKPKGINLFGIIIFKNKKGESVFIRKSFRASAGFIQDASHIWMHDADTLFIYDLEKKVRSRLFTSPDIRYAQVKVWAR